MSIESDSTLLEVFDANHLELTEAQVGTMTSVNVDGDATVSFLLHTFDLTDFKADCATATDNCDPTDYADYDGLALAVLFTNNADTAITTNWGACMPNGDCYYVDPTTADEYAMHTLVETDAFAVDSPTDESNKDGNCDDNTYGFTAHCLGFNALVEADDGPILGWMMYENDQTVYEVGETYDVWTITDLSDNNE